MAFSLAIALLAYPVVSGLIRLALTVTTMPLMGTQALLRSRPGLAMLRLTVGSVCGCGALLTSQQILRQLGHGPSLPLVGALVGLIAAFYLVTARSFRGTPQFVDDLLSLTGEEIGAVSAACWVCFASQTPC